MIASEMLAVMVIGWSDQIRYTPEQSALIESLGL